MKQGDKVLVEAVYVGGDDVGGNCVVDVIGRRLDVHKSAIRPLPDPIPGELRDGWRHFGPDLQDLEFAKEHLIGEPVQYYDATFYESAPEKLTKVQNRYFISLPWVYIAIKETRLQEILTEKSSKETVRGPDSVIPQEPTEIKVEEPRPWLRDWSTCRATDATGREWEFEYSPLPNAVGSYWANIGGRSSYVRDRAVSNWRHTLEYRYPEPVWLEKEPEAFAQKLAEAVGMTVEELRAAVKEMMR